MSTAYVLMLHSVKEQWKSRFFQLIVIFAGVMLYASLLLGAMAVDQEARVLSDFGLAVMELIALAAVVFGCATVILRDIESKTIYLVLTRPVTSLAYLSGKLAGILVSAAGAIACMGILHILLFKFKGYPVPVYYFQIMLSIWFKAAIMGSLAVTISLISTSVLSSVVMVSVFWTLGHFVTEAGFLAEKAGGATLIMLKPVLYLAPNMQLYNLKDRWDVVSAGSSWGILFVYALLYCGACMSISVWLFRKKEF